MLIEEGSTRYVRVHIYDIATEGVTAEIALVHEGDVPIEADWHLANWVSTEVAALLVGPGPGGVLYANGDYIVKVRLTAGSEKPVFTSGRVRIGTDLD